MTSTAGGARRSPRRGGAPPESHGAQSPGDSTAGSSQAAAARKRGRLSPEPPAAGPRQRPGRTAGAVQAPPPKRRRAAARKRPAKRVRWVQQSMPLLPPPLLAQACLLSPQVCQQGAQHTMQVIEEQAQGGCPCGGRIAGPRMNGTRMRRTAAPRGKQLHGSCPEATRVGQPLVMGAAAAAAQAGARPRCWGGVSRQWTPSAGAEGWVAERSGVRGQGIGQQGQHRHADAISRQAAAQWQRQARPGRACQGGSGRPSSRRRRAGGGGAAPQAAAPPAGCSSRCVGQQAACTWVLPVPGSIIPVLPSCR